MDTFILITNGLTAVAFFAFILLIYLIKREGKDERAQFMNYKLFGFLYSFLLVGLAFIIVGTGWFPVDYELLRISLSLLLSLHIFVGFCYWLYLRWKL